MIPMDFGKRLLKSSRGFSKTNIGSRSAKPDVRHGIAKSESVDGYVTVLIDGSEDHEDNYVRVVTDVPIAENQRVTISFGDGTYKVQSVGQIVEEIEAVKKAAAESGEQLALVREDVEDAREAASAAQKAAEDAQGAAEDAGESAAAAGKAAGEADAKAQKAIEDAAAASKEANELEAEIGNVREDAAAMREELEGQIETVTTTMEQSFARKDEVSSVETTLRAEISKSAASLTSTFEQEYAKKTDLTSVEANLQTQINQNAGEITLMASSVEKVQADATSAQTKADAAASAASAAQAAADTAASNASAAQTAADKAQGAADDAKANLATAEAELASVKGRVGATEEDIAAAQKAVEDAQKAADEADAAAAAAQAKADKAEEDAAAAQTAADKAQEAAEAAQKDVDELAPRVTQAETKITQNSEAIELRATKEEFNALGTRVGAAETKITQQAGSITAQAKDISDLGGRMSTVEQTASGITVRLETVEGDVETAQTTATNAASDASDARKTATNYLSFTNDGLVVGDHTGTSLESNVCIDSDSVDIRKGTTVLATFAAKLVELGKDAADAVIKLCKGAGLIQAWDSSNTAKGISIMGGSTNKPTVNLTDEGVSLSAVNIAEHPAGQYARLHLNTDGTIETDGTAFVSSDEADLGSDTSRWKRLFTKAAYFANSNDTASAYKFGIAQWNDKLEVTTRDAGDNGVKSVAFAVNGSDGVVDFNERPTHDGVQLATIEDVTGGEIDLSGYMPKSGGTFTGNVTAPWFQTTSVTDLGKASTKIAVIRDDGWLYYRTPAEILSDIGAAASGHGHSDYATQAWVNGKGYALAADVAATKSVGTATSSTSYFKIADFGEWGTGNWTKKGFSMLISSRAGEMVWVTVAANDSNTDARALRLMNRYSKIAGIYYSVSESAIYVKCAAWANNVCAHILSNVYGDYVPTVATVSGLASDCVEINIVEFGINSTSAVVGDSSVLLEMGGSATRPTYNGADMALLSDVGSVDLSSYLPKSGGTMTGQLLTSFNNSVAMGSYGAASNTVEALVNELRYSSGCMGSVSITTAYTNGSVTIPAGWYNFMYSPHRSGGNSGNESGDNHNYGTLLLFGMNNANGAYRVRYSGGIAEAARFLDTSSGHTHTNIIKQDSGGMGQAAIVSGGGQYNFQVDATYGNFNLTNGAYFGAPADANVETTTAKFYTSNGGAIIFGKEGPNSGTMIRLDQTDGTCRLRFRSSSTAGAMVWEQPEQGAQLYVDLGKDGADKHRVTFPTSAGTLALTSQIPSTSGLMPYSGGRFTGPISFQDSSLPSKTLQFVCGIDAFANGGQMGWQDKAAFLSGYATESWVNTQIANVSGGGSVDLSKYARIDTANTYNGEQKFQNSDYCPTVTDTAPGVGCAFKASRGLANEMLVDKLIMTASTGKLPIYTYGSASGGQMQSMAEKASFTNKGGLIINGGRVNDSGDDEGIVIGRASNNYAGLCLGSATGVRSVFYLLPSNAAVWRWNNGSASYDITHPGKSGTIALAPDSLYSNSSGTTGTVTLSATAANYSILEIFYTDGTRTMSQRVYSPNGKTTILQRSVFSSTSAFYDGSAIVTISGTSITWSNQGRLVIGTGSSQTVEADTSTLKIAYVLGWK